MSRSTRKKSIKRGRKIKATSVMPLCMTAGFFLGIGLGALMSNVLIITALGIAAGAGAGYYVDKRNGIAYTRRKSGH